MPKGLLLLMIGLFFGFGGGFFAAVATNSELKGHDHASHGVPGHGDGDHGPDTALFGPGDICTAENPTGGPTHSHALLDIAGEGPAPKLALVLHPDGPGTATLEMRVQNFRFAPEHVNGPHVPREGHAHIYVDGVKVARAYGPWFQLTGVSVGAQVRVTLNANSHEELAVGDVPVEARITIPAEG